MRAKPWELPDGLWQRIEPLLPLRRRRYLRMVGSPAWGPRSTPARGLPHNSSSSHSQSPLEVRTFCGQRHDAGSRAVLASPPQRAGAIFPVDVLAVSIFGEVVPRT